MNLPRPRAAFTLIELMVAAALAMFLMAVVTTLWFQTQRAVERTRAILAMDMKARSVFDKSLEAIDNRSGCLPLVAGNEAWGQNWTYRVRAFMSRAHIDFTSGSGGEDGPYQGPTGTHPKRWTRHQSPEWRGWRSSFSEPARDLGAGQPLKHSDIGTNGEKWGTGEMAIWHGRALRLEPVAAGAVSWLRGGGPPGSGGKPWVYTPDHFDSEFRGNSWDPATPAESRQRSFSMHSIDRTSLIPSRRFTSGNVTQSLWDDNWRYVSRGPYRGTTIMPVRLYNQNVEWMGRNTLMRVINGPAFDGDAWMSGRYVAMSTGVYEGSGGTEGGSATALTDHNEPPWLDQAEFSGIGTANPADPAFSTDGTRRRVPPYGRIVEETNGPVGASPRWRVEAPLLSVFESTWITSGNGQITNDMTFPAAHNDWDTRGFLTPDFATVTSAPMASFHTAGYGFDQRNYFAANISDYLIRTGRVDGVTPPGPSESRGRFGTLTNRSWTDNSSDGWGFQVVSNGSTRYVPPSGGTAGFYGNHPTASEMPGHPPWLKLTTGIVGGFRTDVESSAIERRWSFVISMR